jgi:maleylpyruvate isomerase
MAIENLTLFGYWRSSSAWRVRIGLALKGLDYTHQAVNLIAPAPEHGGPSGAQHSAEHRARNPLGQVPVLTWTENGVAHRLTQSLAMLAWLDARFLEPPLVPRDGNLKSGRAAAGYHAAAAWERAELVNSGIQPLQNLNVLQAVADAGLDRLAWGRRVIAKGLQALETLATEPGAPTGTYLVGDAPTVADCCLIPQLYNARRFGVDLTACPTLLAIEARCEALASFAAAHPDQQPDRPADAT